MNVHRTRKSSAKAIGECRDLRVVVGFVFFITGLRQQRTRMRYLMCVLLSRYKEEMDCGNIIIFAVMTLVGEAINQLFCFCF